LAQCWFIELDAVALYGFIATRKPRRYVEIGSGTSTKFARRAVTDHSPRTEIISIDPDPRSEIDALCDDVMRMPLEDVPADFFAGLCADDILFFDGSHRAFQNSDVTVFFCGRLPLTSGEGSSRPRRTTDRVGLVMPGL
jgi:hypothetical protein